MRYPSKIPVKDCYYGWVGGRCKPVGLDLPGLIWRLWGYPRGTGRTDNSSLEPLCALRTAILLEEGFRINHRKTRIMRQGVRQHLAGVVTNRTPNIVRSDFDRLKTILTNCVRKGPDSQNRDAHPQFRSYLESRIAFVEMINPAKAKRLRGLYHQIHWQ
jgi:hypothetical protein